jgi:hypothetical protein
MAKAAEKLIVDRIYEERKLGEEQRNEARLREEAAQIRAQERAQAARAEAKGNPRLNPRRPVAPFPVALANGATVSAGFAAQDRGHFCPG